MTGERAGGAFVALSALQFGAVVVLGKVATDRRVGVGPLLSIRFAIAAALLAVTLVASKRALVPARNEMLRLTLLGAIGYGAEASLFFLALERGTAAAVTLLFFVYPVLVAIGGVILGRGSPGALLVGSLTAAVAGTALVVTSAGSVDVAPAGIVFALASAAVFSVYLLAMERTLHRTSSLVAAMWVSGSASLAILMTTLLRRTGHWPLSARQWVPVIATGVFTCGAFIFLFAGLRKVGALRTAIVAALEPLSTTILAILFLSEPLRAGMVAGGVLILGGAVAASLARGAVTDVPEVL